MTTTRPAGQHAMTAIALLLASASVLALDDALTDPTHFDIVVATQPTAAAGARLVPDPQDNFASAAETGIKIVPTNLSDVSGGPHLTDDPGWLMDAGSLVPGEDLGFRARGGLHYWHPDVGRWLSEVPNGETIRVFGGVPAAVAPDLFSDPALADFWLGGTIWTTAGIEGPIEALVAQTADDGDGSIHTHLDFCIQDATGNCREREAGAPARGAYRIELELLSNAMSGNAPKYQDSEPIYIVLANQLTSVELNAAVSALTDPATDEPPADPPDSPGQPADPLPAAVLVPLLDLVLED